MTRNVSATPQQRYTDVLTPLEPHWAPSLKNIKGQHDKNKNHHTLFKTKKVHSRICCTQQAIQSLAWLALLMFRATEVVEEHTHGLWLAASRSALRGLLGTEQRWQSWRRCWSTPASQMEEKLHSEHSILPCETGGYWFNLIHQSFCVLVRVLVHCRLYIIVMGIWYCS